MRCTASTGATPTANSGVTRYAQCADNNTCVRSTPSVLPSRPHKPEGSPSAVSGCPPPKSPSQRASRVGTPRASVAVPPSDSALSPEAETPQPTAVRSSSRQLRANEGIGNTPVTEVLRPGLTSSRPKSAFSPSGPARTPPSGTAMPSSAVRVLPSQAPAAGLRRVAEASDAIAVPAPAMPSCTAPVPAAFMPFDPAPSAACPSSSNARDRASGRRQCLGRALTRPVRPCVRLRPSNRSARAGCVQARACRPLSAIRTQS